ncbi:c-type cytochrome [Micromonospora echinospora]|uniref:c-type cytochrome n=1 Tax=Micromonospora echinospora TaxID=1877 RepID=UPI003A8A003C
MDFQLATGRMPVAAETRQPRRGEPAFSADEIAALVDHVTSFGGGGPQIPRVAPGSLTAGRDLFAANCAPCHSATGSGAPLTDGWIAPPLYDATPVQVAEAIRVGPGLMPVFPSQVLTDQQVNDLVTYVQQLRGQRPDRGGNPLGRLGPGRGHRRLDRHPGPARRGGPLARQEGRRMSRRPPVAPAPPGVNRRIVLSFLASAAGAVGFAVVYGLGGQTQWEGVPGGGVRRAGDRPGDLGTPAGAGRRVRRGTRGPHPAPAEQTLTAAALTAPDAPIRRRGLVATLGLALTALGVAALVPLRSLLPWDRTRPAQARRDTPWGPGVRLLGGGGQPLRPEDVPAGTVVAVFPEGGVDAGDAPAFAVRLRPERFTRPPSAGHLDGLVVYSLLCTHAGCPVRLYLKGAGRILCPCHQSSFDLFADAAPVAGPAARSLPGLPVEVDPDGHLRATADFTAPPGAGFWSRP